MEAVTQRPGQQAGAAADVQGVRSIRRALDILSLLNDDKPVISIRDITDATSLPKTTVLRLVHTLEQSGLLWATAGGYTAGPGLWRWAYLARRSWQLPPETQATMRDLGTEHRETVNLYVLRDICRVCVAQQESPRALGMSSRWETSCRCGAVRRPRSCSAMRRRPCWFGWRAARRPARSIWRRCGNGRPTRAVTGTRSATVSARKASPPSRYR